MNNKKLEDMNFNELVREYKKTFNDSYPFFLLDLTRNELSEMIIEAIKDKKPLPLDEDENIIY